jgi:hypothetical protein
MISTFAIVENSCAGTEVKGRDPTLLYSAEEERQSPTRANTRLTWVAFAKISEASAVTGFMATTLLRFEEQ